MGLLLSPADGRAILLGLIDISADIDGFKIDGCIGAEGVPDRLLLSNRLLQPTGLLLSPAVGPASRLGPTDSSTAIDG